jgi:hypothetical protein
MSAKLVPTFADRECRMDSATDPHGCILNFLDRKCLHASVRNSADGLCKHTEACHKIFSFFGQEN